MVQHRFLLVTYPAQGHINPSLQFAKRLINTAGAHVTFVTSLSAHHRIGNGSIPDGLTYAPFSDGYDDGFKPGDNIDHFWSELRRRGAQAITDLVVSSANEGHPYTCIVYTILLPWAADVAHELHLPNVLLWIQPATVFDIYYYYFNGYKDLIRDNTSSGTNDALPCSIELPGLPLSLTSRDLPSFMVDTNPYNFVLPLLEEHMDLLAMEPGKRSRLWHHEDVTSVLRDESGTKAIRGLTLELPENSDEHPFRTKAFKKMRHLKFLRFKNVKLTGSYRHLSKELRSLCWHGFPQEVIPEDFDLRNLVCIDLSYSKLVRVWEDSDLLPKKLKFLTLDHSRNLTRLPDFSKLPHLEGLSLHGCKSVSWGYHLFAQLQMLQYLGLIDCNITDDAILESLRSLSSLRILVLDGNGFNRLPILSGLSQLTSLYLNHCTNLQAIPHLPTSLRRLEANYCTELEIMPGLPQMSKMVGLQLKNCRKLKDIPNLDNFLCNMYTLHMEGCASLTATFKENILLKWEGYPIDGLSLSVNDIPRRLPYVAREDETVEIEVPPTFDYIGRLVVCIIYSSDYSNCTGSLCIHVVNRTQRTRFLIWPMVTTVTASHECYLWLGNLTNKKLNLKGGDRVRVLADFIATEDDHRIKVKKTGVDIIEWEYILDDLIKVDYKRVPYVSDEDTDEEED